MDTGSEMYLREKRINKIVGLDSLRSIAIIGIFLYHIDTGNFPGGFIGVNIFFVIAGFLITINTINRDQNNKFSIVEFYKKRFIRIYASFLIYVILAVFILWLFIPVVILGHYDEILSIIFGYNNWWQAIKSASYFDRVGSSSPFTHMWYLGVILQFYLIWPFLYKIMSYIYRKIGYRNFMIIFSVLLVCASMVMPIYRFLQFDISRIYYGTDSRAFEILLGVFIGAIYNRKKNEEIKYASVLVGVLILLVTLVLYFTSILYIHGDQGYIYIYGMHIITILVTVLVYIFSSKRYLIGDWFENRILGWISSRSFEIYLTHFTIIFIFEYNKLSGGIFSKIIILLITGIISELLFRMSNLIKNKLFIKTNIFMICILFIIFLADIYIVGFCENVQKVAKEKLEKQLEINLKKNDEDNKRIIEEKIHPEKDKNNETKNKSPENGGNNIPFNINSIGSFTAIGDSLLLQVSPTLQNQINDIYIDGKVSRQLYQIKDIVTELKAQNKLGKNIIIVAGTNGYFHPWQGQELIDEIGKDREIFWVNIYSKVIKDQDKINGVISQLCKDNTNVHLVDWESKVSKHTEWLYEDGTHVRENFAHEYTGVILDEVEKIYTNK